MPKHVSIQGLAERREQRLRERAETKALKLRQSVIPKNEMQEIRAARVWFATLPHRQLLAVYRAARPAFEKETTP